MTAKDTCEELDQLKRDMVSAFLEAKSLRWSRAVSIQEDAQLSRVIINGLYQELPNTPQHSSERRHAYSLLEKRTLWWQTAQAARELRTTQPFPPIFYRIHIDTMTGHRAAPDDHIADYSDLYR